MNPSLAPTHHLFSAPATPTTPATAMILAAGRGQRMRPLTDHTPKPLLTVRGKPLVVWHIEALARQGHQNILINTAWLGEKISQTLGNGNAWGVHLHYSHEGADFGHALETAGGIVRALPRLAPTFWVVAGDVFAPDFSFAAHDYAAFEASPHQAHLWLVSNPPHNPQGDFGLSQDGLALNLPKNNTADHPTNHPTNSPINPRPPCWTYSTIGLFKSSFFAPFAAHIAAGNPTGIAAPLAPWLRAMMDQQRVTASRLTQPWTDVGTPERLDALNQI